MALTIPTIYTAIDKMTGPIQRMAAAMTGFANTSVASMNRASRGFSQLGNAADSAYKKLNVFPAANSFLGAAGITVGIAGAVTAVKKFVGEAAKMEDATASFQALLGGKEAAAGLVAELQKLGARTPFNFDDLSKASNMMIGFGAATKDNVVPTLSMLGDVAMGNADKLQGITLAYSQIIAGGKAMGQDINQLINNGVPILAQLGKQWHMNSLQARKAVSDGKATSAEVLKAFQAMTSKGGMFFNGMEIASQTFNGQMSTLQDTVDQTFAAIGNQALPVLKQYQVQIIAAAGKVQQWALDHQDLIKAKVSEWIEKISNAAKFLINHWDQIITGLKIYIGLLAVLKVTTIAVTLVTNAIAIATGVYNAAMWIARTATMSWYAAQLLLNLALDANPIGLLVIAIAALAAGVYLIIKYWDQWGAAVSFLLGPLGMVISLAMSLYKNWNLVKQAFRNDGILGAIKAIGKVLLDVILAPLQQILEIASKLPGKMGDWAASGAASIAQFRQSMGIDALPESSLTDEQRSDRYDRNETPFPSRVFPIVDPKRFESSLTTTRQLSGMQEVKVEVAAAPGTSATVTKNSGGKLPKTPSNVGYRDNK